jgi:hypothetical protein
MIQMLLLYGALGLFAPLQGRSDSALLDAARRGDPVAVRKALEQGADPNTTNDEGQTSLMLAAQGGHLYVAEQLRARGAKLSTEDNRKMTAFAYALLGGHQEVARYLGTESQKIVEKREKTCQMLWSYREPPPGEESASEVRPGYRWVVLTFVDFPNHSYRIYSPDLWIYLESLGSERVPVVIQASFNSETGKLMGTSLIRIGEMRTWKSESSDYRTVGDYHPAPWDPKPSQ